MLQKFSTLLDHLSEFFAHRKGLLPIIGISLVVLNFLLQVFASGWVTQTNCFLHLGVVLALFALLLAKAL
jgi:hypothetical protein